MSVALCTLAASSGVALASDHGHGDEARSGHYSDHGDQSRGGDESDDAGRWSADDESSGDDESSADDESDSDDESGADDEPGDESGTSHGGAGGAAGSNSKDCGPALALSHGPKQCDTSPPHRGEDGPDHEGR